MFQDMYWGASATEPLKRLAFVQGSPTHGGLSSGQVNRCVTQNFDLESLKSHLPRAGRTKDRLATWMARPEDLQNSDLGAEPTEVEGTRLSQFGTPVQVT